MTILMPNPLERAPLCVLLAGIGSRVLFRCDQDFLGTWGPNLTRRCGAFPNFRLAAGSACTTLGEARALGGSLVTIAWIMVAVPADLSNGIFPSLLLALMSQLASTCTPSAALSSHRHLLRSLVQRRAFMIGTGRCDFAIGLHQQTG